MVTLGKIRLLKKPIGSTVMGIYPELGSKPKRIEKKRMKMVPVTKTGEDNPITARVEIIGSNILPCMMAFIIPSGMPISTTNVIAHKSRSTVRG
jgi:hypothetical protein